MSAVPHRRVVGFRWAGRAFAIVSALALALLVTAVPAAAHDVLVSSDPVEGATLNTAPARVQLTFNQPVRDFDPVLKVIGPNGNVFSTAPPTISGGVVSAPMVAGPAGEYRAVYRVVSADGHPVTGQISFALSAAAAGTATGQPDSATAQAPDTTRGANGGGAANSESGSAGNSAGAGRWLWVGIGVAAVVVVLAIVIALRRPPPGRGHS